MGAPSQREFKKAKVRRSASSLKPCPPVTLAPSLDAQATDGHANRSTFATPSAVPFSIRGVGCGGSGSSFRPCSRSCRFSSSMSAAASSFPASSARFPFAEASRSAEVSPCFSAWCASRASFASR